MGVRALVRRVGRRAAYELKMRGFDTLHSLGLSGAALQARPGGRILTYHGLDRRGGSGFNTRFIGVDAFERQVAWLSENFRIVTLDQYFAGARDPDRFTACLTFDDGYASSLDLALPVLERYRAPATFFVTAIGAVGGRVLWPDVLDIAMHLHRSQIRVRDEVFQRHARKGEYISKEDGSALKARCKNADWDFIRDVIGAFPRELTAQLPEELQEYWRMLDENGLRQLAASPLVTIGSHGVRHTTLPNQSPAIAQAEMADSKRWIEDVIGRKVRSFAFPDGAWNEAVLVTAADIGFTQLLGGDAIDDASSPHTLYRGRFTMNPFISWPNQVRCIYRGSYR